VKLGVPLAPCDVEASFHRGYYLPSTNLDRLKWEVMYHQFVESDLIAKPGACQRLNEIFFCIYDYATICFILVLDMTCIALFEILSPAFVRAIGLVELVILGLLLLAPFVPPSCT
jgi:hypothetical protein